MLLFSIRGRLSSIGTVIRNLGVLNGFILGAFINYAYVPCICIIFPIVFMVVFSILPNTPQYHLHRGRIQVNIHIYILTQQKSSSNLFCDIFFRKPKMHRSFTNDLMGHLKIEFLSPKNLKD